MPFLHSASFPWNILGAVHALHGVSFCTVQAVLLHGASLCTAQLLHRVPLHGASLCTLRPLHDVFVAQCTLRMEHPFSACFAWHIPLHDVCFCTVPAFVWTVLLHGASLCTAHLSHSSTFARCTLCIMLFCTAHPWCSACFARPIPSHGVSFCIPLCAPSFCTEHPCSQLTFCTVHPFARRIPLHSALLAQRILFAQSPVHCRAALQSRARLRHRQHPEQTAPWGGGVPFPTRPRLRHRPFPSPQASSTRSCSATSRSG